MSPRALKYMLAFVAGVVSVLVPTMLAGQWPVSADIPKMIGAGIVATGLYHLPSPQRDATDASPGE